MVFDRDDDMLCDDTIYYLYRLWLPRLPVEIADGALGVPKQFQKVSFELKIKKTQKSKRFGCDEQLHSKPACSGEKVCGNDTK